MSLQSLVPATLTLSQINNRVSGWDYIEGVVADALGDWGMGVGAGAHGGGGF